VKWVTKEQILYDSTYWEVPTVVKFTDTENRMLASKKLGGGEMRSYCLMSKDFHFCKMKSSRG
jgi:hypothetical protein